MTQADAVRAWVGVGANLGDAVATVRGALAALDTLTGTRVMTRSSLYRSAPIDAGGPDFINAVAELRTTLSAADLLAALHALESAQGRERPYRNAPRTLDLDLLLHGDQVSQAVTLTLPHPRLHLRAFVLRPLLEIAPTLAAPVLGPLAAYLPAVADQRIAKLEE